MTSINDAIVLCAGRGKRLRPHTDNTPKPLLPVDGKPTLDYILHSLKLANINRVCLVNHYLSEQIEDYATSQSIFAPDCVTCVTQTELAGTADATMAAIDALPDWFGAPFLLTASDYLVPADFYTALVNAYQRSGKEIAVSLKRLPDEELSARSSVRFDDHGYVSEVVEKPAPGKAPSSLGANLVYILPSEIVSLIQSVAPSSRGEKEIQSAVNAFISEHGSACGLEQAVPPEWTPAVHGVK